MNEIKLQAKDGSEVKFYFSNLDRAFKFSQTVRDEIEETNTRIMKVYKGMFNIDLDLLAMVRHYIKCERRLFRIEHKGETYTCLNEIQFSVNYLIKTEY